jgi:hypothetical protein
MKKEDLRCYEGKKIKILLKNNFVYTCSIQEFLEDCIKIRDRFGNLVLVSLGDISMITEIQEDFRK